MKNLIWIKNLEASDRKTLKIAFLVTIILSIISTILAIIISWWLYTWFLSIFIGYLSALFCYIKLVNVVINATNGAYKSAKKAFIINNISTLFIYFIALLICTIFKPFNIFLCFAGILTIKVVLIFQYGKSSNKEV